MKITVCWKWVAVDGGQPDARWAGVSPADEAALEVALRIRNAAVASPSGGRVEVVVVTVGPPDSDAAMREALAAGADTAVRIDATEASSRDVAASLADVAGDSDYVLCGDYSLDRGTGSVPAYVAAVLHASQALGLIGIDTDTGANVDADTRPIRVTRRLDAGRREVLDVSAPAVLSFEGSVARLRRASLAASLAAKTAPITVVPGPPRQTCDAVVTSYRPRARALPGPAGGTLARVRDLLDIGGEVGHTESVTLDPPDAARRIVDQLNEWGYLDAERRLTD